MTMKIKSTHFDTSTSFLVTGGAGFIGSNICASLLSEGYMVRCLDSLVNGKMENIIEFMNHPNFTFIEGDIRDYTTCITACDGIDYVLHQAALGSVPRSVKYPLMYEEVNVLGTLNVMEAARQKAVKRLVYASSSSVYGDALELPKLEGSEGNVLSPYALTKKTNEEYGRLYAKLYGLETVGLRYFNVFGQKQDPNGDYAAVIPKFIKLLLNDERPTINGNGLQSRDFTYIENVVEANIKACSSPKEVAGEVFNIACGERKTLLEVYEKLSTILGKSIEPVFASERVGDIKHSHADISKAKKLIGYNPRWSFEEGIEEAIQWYRENL